MENYIKQLEQRIIDLERRFLPIEKVLYEKMESEIEVKKMEDITINGTNYTISAVIETNLGTKTIQFNQKGYTEKQALYFAQRDVIFPQMSKLKDMGKVQWFKTISKQIIQ